MVHSVSEDAGAGNGGMGMVTKDAFRRATLVFAACCLLPNAYAKEGGTMKKSEFFQKVDALGKIEVGEPEQVARALGLALTFEKTDSSKYTDTFEARPSTPTWFRRVEVRAARGGSTGGIVVVEIASGFDIRPDDLVRRFKGKIRFDVKSPHAPPSEPDYYVFAQPGQELSFAVRSQDPRLLQEVVLNRQ